MASHLLVLVDVGELAVGRLLADNGDAVGVLRTDLVTLLLALVCKQSVLLVRKILTEIRVLLFVGLYHA